MAKRFLSTVSIPALEQPPNGVHQGELYYNTVDKTVHVHDGIVWNPVSVPYLKQMFMGGNHEGIDLIFDESTNTLNLSLQASAYTKEPTGFTDLSSSIISYNQVSRSVTVAPRTSTEFKGTYDNGADYNIGDVVFYEDKYWTRILPVNPGYPPGTEYWENAPKTYIPNSYVIFYHGKKFIKTSTSSITIPNTPGIHYVYFDEDANIQTSSQVFSFKDTVPIAIVVIGDDGSTLHFGEERHGLVMDWATHYYLHRTNGTQIVPGSFAAGGYNTDQDGTQNSHAQISIANGTIFDEDNDFSIIHALTPTNEGEQFLDPYIRVPVYYKVNGNWKKRAVGDFAISLSDTNSLPEYNVLNAASWELSEVPNNNYFASYIVATNNIIHPIIAIMGQRVDNNIGNAVSNNNYNDLDLSGLPSTEFAPLYRVVFQHKNTYTNTPKSVIQDVTDIRSTSAGSSGTSTNNDHGNMVGLLDDDHTQYIHISNPRTITAAHTFNNSGPAFLLGANAVDQLIVGLNAEKVGGKTYSEINQEAFTYAQQASSDALLAAKGYTDQEIADLIGTAPNLLDTLGELSDALNDDANFASTVTSALAGKANIIHSHTKSDITDFTEEVQDAASQLFNHLNHNNITVTYDDVNNKIIFTATAQLTQEQVQDYVSPLLAHNNHTNIQASYDDELSQLILEAIIPPSKAIMSATAPIEPADGEFWFDTDEFRSGTTRALKIWNALTSAWEYVSSDLSLSTTNVWTAKNTFNQGVIVGLNAAPQTPIHGQIYYDTTTNKLRAYNGSAWVNIESSGGGGGSFDLISTDTSAVPAIMFFGATAPSTNPNIGDIWFDIDDISTDSEFIHIGPNEPSSYDQQTLWIDTDEPEGQLIYSDEDPPTGDKDVGDLWIDLDDLAGQLVHIGSDAPDAEDSALWVDTTTEEGLETFTVEDVFEGNRSVYSLFSALPDPATHGGMIAFVESEQQYYVAFSNVPEIQNGLTFTVTKVEGQNIYKINNQTQPQLNLERGKRYLFSIDTPGHNFWIKTQPNTGTAFGYPTGITNNGESSGLIVFDVPYNAPDILYYTCQNHTGMYNQINISGVINPTGFWEPLIPDQVQRNMINFMWMGL